MSDSNPETPAAAGDEALTEKQRLRKERAKQKAEEKAAKAEAKKKADAAKKAASDAAKKEGGSSSGSGSDAPAPAAAAAAAPKGGKKGGAAPAEKESQPADKKKDEGPRLRRAFVNEVPIGEKKPISSKLDDMPKEYDVPYVESSWYEWWEKQGYFHPEESAPVPDEEKFVIVIPPPNVTGALHIGHALTNSIQDVLCRWHRMNGKTVLWVPGTDHAGIATQDVVEKQLIRRENKTRRDYGREAFVKEVWKWKEEYGSRICNQLRRLGSSLDWKREVFTLDEKLSKAVIEAFVRFYNDGLIYRENRLVNWCCRLQTAISDIEVEHKEFEGHTKLTGNSLPGHDPKNSYDFGCMVHFAYKVEGSEDEELVIATTRIETMLGDVAVAVNPDDERYHKFHGKFLVHPFCDRRLPVICDGTLVKIGIGTGCVKVTPAHDENDYACGKRHGLEAITIFNDDGTMNSNVPEQYRGMMRFDCRQRLIEDLKEKGLFRELVNNPMRVGVCSRSGDIIEPMLKPQWYVKCGDMAKRAADAVRNGELKLIPEVHEREWFKWLDNIRDWCISRQLWWGHRIPAYEVVINGEVQREQWIVAHSEEDALAQARAKYPDVPAESISLKQEEDVLDTWFSSGLFPFSVFGWPEETNDLARFYPTSLLETGCDILFFWVARMVMMGQQLTGKLPFQEVFLHSLVKDAFGRKMSKSKGNIVDPIDVIEGINLEALHEKLRVSNMPAHEVEKAIDGQKKMFPKGISECGTDAMRFALCNFCANGKEIHLNIPVVVSYRNFCNKLWNATRYAMMKWGDDYKPAAVIAKTGNESQIEEWLLSRLEYCVTQVHRGFATWDFSLPTNALFNFLLEDLCQVYLEVARPVLSAKEDSPAKASGLNTLYNSLEMSLRMLHPFMPFVTEELWQRLPRRDGDKDSIMVSPIPRSTPEWRNESLEKEFEVAQECVRVLRQMRNQYNLSKQRPVVVINAKDDEIAVTLEKFKGAIQELSDSGETEVQKNTSGPQGAAVECVTDRIDIFMVLKDMINFEDEIVKLNTKIKAKEGQVSKLVARTKAATYESKVPLEVREKTAKEIEQFNEEIESMKQAISKFQQLVSSNQ